MTITASDFVWRKAVTSSDSGSNGGRMGTAEVTHNVKNNLYPDVSQAQRIAGLTRYRKLFALVRNAENLALQNAKVHLSRVSAGDDYHVIFAGTQNDTQDDIATPRLYGIALLATSPASGATSFDCTLEDASLASCFQTGDSIWIGNDGGGEYFDNVTVNVVGATVSVSLNAGDALASSYTAGDARCASVLTAAEDVQASVSNWSESSSSGTYDESAHPLEVPNIGAVEDSWLLTFTSTDSFTVEGTHTGALASGSISSDYPAADNNPNGGRYFTLRAAGFSGSWQAGDTLSFNTHPAALPIWLREIVPAGAAAASLTVPEVTITGESS